MGLYSRSVCDADIGLCFFFWLFIYFYFSKIGKLIVFSNLDSDMVFFNVNKKIHYYFSCHISLKYVSICTICHLGLFC